MEGEQSLKKFSPVIKIQDPSIKDSIPLLPRIILFHGTGDYSIPSIAR
jgi:prenylcysteine alpha-carboxyl methylesterase